MWQLHEPGILEGSAIHIIGLGGFPAAYYAFPK